MAEMPQSWRSICVQAADSMTDKHRGVADTKPKDWDE